MAVAAVAAGIGAVGSIAGGLMAKQQSDYQAQVAKMNESIANENAQRAITRTGIEAEDQDRFGTAVLLGEQEAAQSASGLSLSGKSAIRTRAAARMLGRRDSLNIIQGGQIEAYNYKTQASNFAADATAARLSGNASLIGGFFDAAGGLAGAYATAHPGASLIGGAKTTAKSFIPKPVPKPVGLVY